MRIRMSLALAAALPLCLASAPTLAAEAGNAVPSPSALQKQARELFGTLPREARDPANPITPAKVKLGRMLYYDGRLSKDGTISCNSCHLLDHAGVDGDRVSTGVGGQKGVRNAPTVYNAAFQFAQFWDGRAKNVEEQAKGPMLNPVEMGMPSEQAVVKRLKGIPGYAPLFAAAFPGAHDPISFDHVTEAIGAFERTLVTPSPLDRFIAGDRKALSPGQQQGLAKFISTGCTTCHMGVDVGGGMFQKLGLVHPYTKMADKGRQQVTGKAADYHIFKVASLRNVARTAPYFTDGSIATLPEAVRLMAWHQLGKKLDAQDVHDIVTFLGALNGTIDPHAIAKPKLP